MVVITDWLLTVAAIGDSKAVMDTGGQFLEVSPEHRVHHHLAEQARLKKAGSYLAPIRYPQLQYLVQYFIVRVIVHHLSFVCCLVTVG